MQKWTYWLVIAAMVALMFVAIPISLSNDRDTKSKLIFDEYIDKFNKSYKNDPAEYETRFQHFKVNLDEIEKLNALSRGSDQSKALYGLTKLSDMSKLEYKDVHLSDEKMTKVPQTYGRSWGKEGGKYTHDENHEASSQDNHIVSRIKRAAMPLQVDWRTKGVIGPVRNQGLCGACWAFSTVGTAEAMAAIKTGKLQTLSVQEMIDCAGLGNSGCAGGDICLLLDWLLLTGSPLEKDSEYPLSLADGTCKIKKNATGIQLQSFTCDDFVGAEDKILEAIATHGPVAVAVNALTWQNYLGGVIQYHCSGSPTDLNHAVELVGYDMTGEVPYYIAKNSWGSDFGNSGYLNLAIGNNICGLANEVATVDVRIS